MQNLTKPDTTPSNEQLIQTTAVRPKVDVLKAARLRVAAQARLSQAPSRFAEPPATTTPAETSDATALSTVLRKSSSQPLTRTARRRASASSRAVEATRAVRPGQAYAGLRQRGCAETREQILERLTNPVISLREASVLLRVCPATVRRYTKSGLLPYTRTEGQQRRFYFKDVLALMRQLEKRPR